MVYALILIVLFLGVCFLIGRGILYLFLDSRTDIKKASKKFRKEYESWKPKETKVNNTYNITKNIHPTKEEKTIIYK